MAVLSLGLLVGPRIGMASMLSNRENPSPSSRWWNWPLLFPTLPWSHQPLKYHFGQNIKKEKKDLSSTGHWSRIKQSLPAVELSEVGYDDAQDQLTLNIRSMDHGVQAFVNKRVAIRWKLYRCNRSPVEAPYALSSREI